VKEKDRDRVSRTDSGESNNQEADRDVGNIPRRTTKRKGSEWEILANLEKGASYTIKPKKHEGYFSKRRKWPLKGWHKRYFVIEAGVMTYAKSQADFLRGRTLGKFNIGDAVISANFAEMRIDIDSEEQVHHVRLEGAEQFGLFLEQLQQHRLSQQHRRDTSGTAPSEEEEIITSRGQVGSLTRGLRPGRANILTEFSNLDENISSNIQNISSQIGQLMDFLQKCEPDDTHATLSASSKKKWFPPRKKKSNKEGKDPIEDQNSESNLLGMSASSLSSSNPSLASVNLGLRPVSLPPGEISRTGSGSAGTYREEALALACEIQAEIVTMNKTYLHQRDQIRIMLENDSKSSTLQPQIAVVTSLKQTLKQVLEQNSNLKTRLARIHAESEMTEPAPAVGVISGNVDGAMSLQRGMNGSLSYSSSCMSEFFDAREYADTDREDSDEDCDDSDESCPETEPDDQEDHLFLEAVGSPIKTVAPNVDRTGTLTGRRRKLPVPQTEIEGVNLWNLLCKNIGKDLSKISMPVTLNEPLSTLQRLAEELEYSDLVDKAVAADTALDRMMWVTAFAISAYGSCNARASHKPFNPLLGETYECIREDKGYKYVAEQVCHHPPISAVNAKGTGWTWSQVLRIRSKFWGKSMEFQPEGVVSLVLGEAGEEYQWNKVTSCLHNLFGAERWVDLYGESVISCAQTGLTAKIQFVKASYWSNKRHELSGTVTSKEGKVLLNLFGTWSEALYVGKAPSAKCIWRPGSLPEDAGLYYGFSRFAMELNEVTGVESGKLPPTDTRLRPDQRALEEGRVGEAESIKLGVEQAQRDRRRQREHQQLEAYTPAWFTNTSTQPGEPEPELLPDKWRFNEEEGNNYWDAREKGFQGIPLEPLW